MSQFTEDFMQLVTGVVGQARGDIQKALGVVDRLRGLASERTINKIAIRSALIDLKASVHESKWTAFGAAIALLGSQNASADPTINKGFQAIAATIVKLFDDFSSKLDAAVLMVDALETDDTKIRQTLTDVCWPVTSFGIMYGKLASILNLDPIGGLGWISRLVENKSLA